VSLCDDENFPKIITIFRTPEFNILSLAFLSSKETKHIIAILYFDCDEKIRLHARELSTSAYELDPTPSLFLRECVPSPGAFALSDIAPSLIPVPPLVYDDSDETFRGGVLLVGGRKVILYEVTDSKYRRHHKSSKSISKEGKDAEKGPVKDSGGKPRNSVDWPFAEVSAYVHLYLFYWPYLISN
jgi:DNA damage-binding protein 1